MRSLIALALVLAVALVAVAPAAAHFEQHPLSKVAVQNIVHAQDGGVISIDAPILNGTGSTVTVSWSGLSSKYPGKMDWIGVWSPKPADYKTTSPSKYKFVTPDANGAGSTTLWLVNMRASYVVVYFTGGLTDPILLAESSPVEFSNYHLPLQIHLALTTDPTQMRIDWNSQQNSFPSLQWGTSADNLNNTVIQVLTSTYTAADMCGAPATTTGWHEPGYLHSVLIQGLTPGGVQYFYQLGDESSGSKSDVLSFYSAPAPTARTAEFVIFGDLGQVETDGSNEASQMDGSILTTLALKKDFDAGAVKLNASAAVFHIGDISYARGYATLWEQFFYQLSPMSPFVPWMTVDGNHERDFPGSGSLYTGTDSGGECGVALESRFHMPTPGKDQTWWSLDFGPVHFTIMSTEHSFNESSPQYEFIKADWAKVNRSVTPFLVLAGHRPMYIDSTNASPDGGDLTVGWALQAALEPLMVQYQCDVAFWGHHHSYQRTCAVHNNTCVNEEDGTIHIVTGAAGAGFSTNIQSPAPAWIQYVEDNTHGYIRARVENEVLSLEFVNAGDNSVMDSVQIKSKHMASKPQTASKAPTGAPERIEQIALF